jgi:hypothetical protein
MGASAPIITSNDIYRVEFFNNNPSNSRDKPLIAGLHHLF